MKQYNEPMATLVLLAREDIMAASIEDLTPVSNAQGPLTSYEEVDFSDLM